MLPKWFVERDAASRQPGSYSKRAPNSQHLPEGWNLGLDEESCAYDLISMP